MKIKRKEIFYLFFSILCFLASCWVVFHTLFLPQEATGEENPTEVYELHG